MARRKEPKIPDALRDQLLGGADAKTAFDPNGLLDELKKAGSKAGQATVIRALMHVVPSDEMFASSVKMPTTGWWRSVPTT